MIKHSTRALMNKEREELPLSNILFNFNNNVSRFRL